MYYIGLDVHKRTISYCVKDAAGRVQMEGKIGSTRRELDSWIKTLPQPRTIAMEATIFGRQGDAHAHFQAAQQAHSTCAGRGREAGAQTVPRTGPPPRKGDAEGQSKPRHAGRSQEAGLLD